MTIFVCMLYFFSAARVWEGWGKHGMVPLSTIVLGGIIIVGFITGKDNWPNPAESQPSLLAPIYDSSLGPARTLSADVDTHRRGAQQEYRAHQHEQGGSRCMERSDARDYAVPDTPASPVAASSGQSNLESNLESNAHPLTSRSSKEAARSAIFAAAAALDAAQAALSALSVLASVEAPHRARCVDIICIVSAPEDYLHPV